jgi:hypothetical protein
LADSVAEIRSEIGPACPPPITEELGHRKKRRSRVKNTVSEQKLTRNVPTPAVGLVNSRMNYGIAYGGTRLLPAETPKTETIAIIHNTKPETHREKQQSEHIHRKASVSPPACGTAEVEECEKEGAVQHFG